MSQIDLQERFPEMTPLKSPPSLFTINGCGLGMYGHRDADAETGTYVKTRSVCFLFVPLLALNAFRVADANSGWYFLGKVPLSAFAKMWNAIFLCCVLAGVSLGWWQSHANSPDAIAARKLEKAREHAAGNRPAEAARLYREVALGETKHAAAAQAGLRELLSDHLPQCAPESAVALLGEVRQFQQAGGAVKVSQGMVPAAIALAEQHAGANLEGAVAVLAAAAPLVDDADQQKSLAQARVKLLEQLVAQQPDNLPVLSQLAVLYEAEGELEKCEQLLAPHADQLGTEEAARVLGQIYSQRDEFEAAEKLLVPYAETRLAALHAAEAKLQAAFERLQQSLIQQLSDGKADAEFYRQYEAAPEAQQQAMVQDWIFARMKGDPALLAAQAEFRQQTGIVPVSLDLGVVQLRHAQALSDPQARRQKLESAEKTLLDVQGAAGDSDEYRLSLGQVYYWLGKHDQGRKQFDQVLAASPDNFELRLSVGNMLRDVGAESEARQLAEQAYESAAQQEQKHMAAALRSLLSRDLDDRILWLERSGSSQPRVAADLADARAQKALREGRDVEAQALFQQSIDYYESLPESAAALNNGALAYFGLFGATRDRAKYERGLEMLERSVALSPSHSAVVYNTAAAALRGALLATIGDEIDLRLFNMDADLDLLPYLYQNATEQQACIDRLRRDPLLAKAVSYLEKTVLLAPKRSYAYGDLNEIYANTDNAEALRGLSARLAGVELDESEYTRASRELYTKANDAKYRQSAEEGIRLAERAVEASRQKDRRSFAVAVGQLARRRGYLILLEDQVDPNPLCALAEEAYQADASAGARSTLIAVLCMRCDLQLAEQNTQYAALATKTRRSVAGSDRLCAALALNEGLRSVALAHPDLQRAAQLAEEQFAAVPSEAGPWLWAVLRHTNSAAADRVAQAVQNDEVGGLSRQIQGRLHPLSTSTALHLHWDHVLSGRAEEGFEVLRRIAAEGVALPLDVPADVESL